MEVLAGIAWSAWVGVDFSRGRYRDRYRYRNPYRNRTWPPRLKGSQSANEDLLSFSGAVIFLRA